MPCASSYRARWRVHEASVLDAHEIVPTIWQGAMPQPADVDPDRFRLLVLMAHAYEYRPGAPDAAHYPGPRVVHAPIDDDGVSVSEADGAAALVVAVEVARYARAGHRVLVTCRLGLNRSGLVSALALRALTGLSPSRCIATVQRKRPGALGNPGMRAFILQRGGALALLP